MNADLELYFNEKRDHINRALQQSVAGLASVSPVLQEAMTYSLFVGGKRLRPILTLAAAEALVPGTEASREGDHRIGGPSICDVVLPYACALEMIHTYSLIHDDLPAMDDDDTRRGQPTNHKVYGEAVAILAGDALLTRAFGLMTQCKGETKEHQARLLELIAKASAAAGAQGMVGGQAADIQAETGWLSVNELIDVHRHKTGALLRLSVEAGAVLAGANRDQHQALTQYAERIGLAFQIQDDILDVVGNPDITGKPVGSDETLHKSTFPALLGLEESTQRAYSLIAEAKACITDVPGIEHERLCDIADFLVQRHV